MPDAAIDGPVWSRYADLALRHLVATHRVVTDDDPSDEWEDEAVIANDLAETRREFLESLSDTSIGFGAIAANARLSGEECDILAVALACELDVRRQGVLAHLQGHPSRTRLSLQTVGWLLGGLERCAVAIGPESRLRRAALLEVAGDMPWAQQALVVPPTVVWAFLGDNSLDADLPHGAKMREVDDASGSELVVVYGPDRVRRREAALLRTEGDRFLVVPAPTDDAGWAGIVREATLGGCGVVVEIDGSLGAEGRRWIERADHLAWAISCARELPLSDLPDRPWREVDAPRDELTDEEWSDAFGTETPRTHRLSPQQVEQVRKAYGARDNDLDAAVRRLLAGPLESVAQRIRPRHTWGDLILSPAKLEQLREIVARYRHAGQVYDRWGFSPVPSRGLVALFSGVSGTGKTLAAEILASELGLDMFKLDLSSVVSKYIGETEKNLEQVFDAAGTGNVVLFFDEADSMFGKRSEVKDARDRYANLEVSYLLQRIESFDGIVVLATNFEKSIDDAFLRRIHARLEFQLPDVEERCAIWRRHIPETAPLDGVDLEWLAAQFELSGGQIRNAAVHAAFLAAAAGTAITMDALVRGVAQEVRKAGRLLRPDEFGSWYPAVAN